MKATPVSLLAALLLAAAVLAAGRAPAAPRAAARPNVLWISCEDASPWLGFCGEPYATTPNLDRLARSGVRYTSAFAPAPVCSPCRFSMITGLYATSMGAQGLRSQFPLPERVRGFPAILRDAGYYCSNNSKTDYNTSAEPRLIAESWDASGPDAHWRGRKPGQPFFAVFNLMETHQSRVFGSDPVPGLEPAERHDPAGAPVPPYFPATAEARRTLARVHDCFTAMDRRAGAILGELERDGLAEETIVFFWSDHGQGIPRGKRMLWDTGLKVPLVIRFPERFRALAPAPPGAAVDRLVSLIDLGPSLLSLLGLRVPAGLHGRPFLGRGAPAPRRLVYGARDRVDEAFDLSRSVRDSRWLYVRNYMPHLSWNQPEGFSDQLPLRRELARMAAEGRLDPAQLAYAGPTRPLEALYDTESDPWQLKNLAEEPSARPVLARMRRALRQWLLETRDLGFLPETEAERLCAGGRPLSEAARRQSVYPLERVMAVADRVGRPGQAAALAPLLADESAAVRYWAAVGLRAAGPEARTALAALRGRLGDPAAAVRLEAAGALAALADEPRALAVLEESLESRSYLVATQAARTLQLLGDRARPAAPAMRRALGAEPHMYVRFALDAALERLGGERQSESKERDDGDRLARGAAVLLR